MKRRDYKCAISGRVCPFNDDDTWEWGGADDVARDNCPIQAYENSNRREGDTLVLDDWCKHLIARNPT